MNILCEQCGEKYDTKAEITCPYCLASSDDREDQEETDQNDFIEEQMEREQTDDDEAIIGSME